jgi:hypothetical protein
MKNNSNNNKKWKGTAKKNTCYGGNVIGAHTLDNATKNYHKLLITSSHHISSKPNERSSNVSII